MGVKRLAEIAAALIAAGRDPDEPAAAIERGTLAGPAHRHRDPRRRSPTRSSARRIGAPALIVVGPVAARREALAWLERRPLHGRSVVVTRARAQASGLAATPARARRRGGRAAGDPDRAADRERRGPRARSTRSATYALVCLTSPNGVAPAVRGDGRRRASTPARSPARPSPRSGPAPRAALRRARRRSPTSSPSASSPRRWSRRWPESRSRAAAVLVARAAEARDVLPDAPARARRRGRRRRPLRDRPRGARAPRRSRPRRAPTTSPSPPPRPSRNLTEALGDRFPRRRPRRLDRPGDQRGGARGRPRGRRRGRAPRHRRPGRGALADAPTSAIVCKRQRVRDELRRAAPALPASPTRPTPAPASWPRPAPRTGPSSPPPSRPPAAGARAAAGPRRRARRCSTRRSSARSTSATCCCRSPSRSPSARRPRSSRPGIECRIKWPNDVWLDGRKLAGILIEARPQDGWAVIGVGLNLAIAPDEFPPELRETAISSSARPRGPGRSPEPPPLLLREPSDRERKSEPPPRALGRSGVDTS